VEELTEWRYEGLGHLGISICLFPFLLGPGPVQLVSAQVIPPSEIQSIGGGVSLCTRRYPWLVQLGLGTFDIVRACMWVVSSLSTCTQQPGSYALKKGDKVMALSSMCG
jgi:hypothetical protein